MTVSSVAAAPEDKPYNFLQVFHEVLGLTRANYVEPTDEAALLEGAYRGMLSSLDAASAYLAPGEEKELQSPPGSGRTGMEVLPSGGIGVVVRIDPGTPAEKAGIKVGDQIWRLSGKGARQLSWPQLRKRLSGKPGETLSLTILDGSNFKMRDLTLVLAARSDKGFKLTYRPEGVIYLRLQDPEALDAAGLKKDLVALVHEHSEAPLLIDLRGVVGLEPQSLVPMAGLLFDGGPLLQLTPRKGPASIIQAPASSRSSSGPIAALIDGSTAGVGEAIAALLRERSQAKLYGRTSFGLGATPELIPLATGGTLLLTTKEMKTSAGVAWSGKGLEPDIAPTPAADRAGDDDANRDPLLDETIKLILNPKPQAPAQKKAA